MSEHAPVYEEELYSWCKRLEFSYVATAPERWIIVFRYKDEIVCAEPPAGVSDQVAVPLSAGLKGEYGEIEAEAGFAQVLNTTIKQLDRRTQSLNQVWSLV